MLEAKESYGVSEEEIATLPVRVHVESPEYEADLALFYSSTREKVVTNSTTAMPSSSTPIPQKQKENNDHKDHKDTASTLPSNPPSHSHQRPARREVSVGRSRHGRSGASPQSRFFNASYIFNRRLAEEQEEQEEQEEGRGWKDASFKGMEMKLKTVLQMVCF